MNYDIYRLIARPSFLIGMASLFDFQGSLLQYNYSETAQQADMDAIASDWEAIGNDLKKAMGACENPSCQRAKA